MMTASRLIHEGRILQRPSVVLRPTGTGPAAAVWYERDDDEVQSTGHRCWLTIDTRHIPGLPAAVSGFVTIFTDEEECEGGRVEITSSWPERAGTTLYAHAAEMLPPIDAVFLHGSDAVGEWLRGHGWDRTIPYNSNFPDHEIVDEYERLWMKEFPLYFDSDIYAILGGWHMAWPDGDWYDLLDEQLMVMTIRDSEPWVETWRSRTGQFNIFQRIT